MAWFTYLAQIIKTVYWFYRARHRDRRLPTKRHYDQTSKVAYKKLTDENGTKKINYVFFFL